MINKNKSFSFYILLGLFVSFGLVSTSSASDFSNTYAKNIGGTSTDVALASVTDANGNMYITGYFHGTADFDPGANFRGFTSKGAGDVFIQKVNANGSYGWVRRVGGTSDEHGNAITLDADGNIYVTGYFNGTADFDPGEPVENLSTSGGADAFVLKLDSRGRYVWAKNMGGNSWTVGNSIAVDANGNVYSKGLFAGTTDFDPGAGTVNITAPGGQTYLDQIYISKLDSSGNYVLAKSIGGNLWDTGYSLALDSNANIYSTGYFEGTVDFDPGAGTANLTASSDDIYVLKLDKDANYVWAKKMGGSGSDVGLGIAIDSSNNVYTAGYFNGTADFDPSASTANLTSNGGKDVFVAKLDSNGDYVWAKSMGGSGDDSVSSNSIAIDFYNNVYTAGYFNGTADFDPSASTMNLVSGGAGDIFMSVLDGSGNYVSAVGIGSTGNDQANSINLDSSKNMYVVGQFEGTVDFAPGATTRNLTSSGAQDGFYAKFNLVP